ncbi:UvrD-helicase domain-containing protein [Fundidesulfovibrio butyratiphilus]
MIEQLQASAGSGKTYSLTRRFLGLLLASAAHSPAACGEMPGGDFGPESILAITFTNKAAAEMKARAIETLKHLALGHPDPDFADRRTEAAAWLENILRHSHLLNIRTIDSLLHLMARLFALELGLPPDFEASLDQEAVFEALFDRVIAGLDQNDPELEALIAGLADALMEIDGVKGFWLGRRVRERLLEVFRHQLDGKGAPAPDPLALRDEVETLMLALLQSVEAMADSLAKSGVEALSGFATLLGKLREQTPWRPLPTADTYAYKSDLSECVKKAFRNSLTPDQQALYTDFRRAWSQARTRTPLLRKSLALHPFLELGDRLAQAFEAHIRETGTALLSSLPAKVAALLAQAGGVPEAYCRLGVRLHHLLIDEFQDTSLSQWAVLVQLAQECLSKGGSLFYVGDVKQAIYGWRGGEPELFAQAATQPELTILAQTRVDSLPCNWRSEPVVVEFNNALFGQFEKGDASDQAAGLLLPEGPEAVRARLAESLRQGFSGCRQTTPANRDPKAGYVRVQALSGDTQADYAQSVREAFAELMQDDLLKRLDPGEVAVLTRSNTEASLAAKWLTDMDQPVVTENSLLVGAHPIVRGALAFLGLIDYPADNMAFWNFLACQELYGAISGTTRQQMADWLASQSPGQLSANFRRDFPEVWSDFFAPFLHGASLMTPYDAVRELFAACDTFAVHPRDEAFLRRFLELVHQAETAGYGSLSSFLEFWRERGHEEKLPQSEEAVAVRVLTMHKAKGLQYPVVVTPFTLFSTRASASLADLDVGGRTLTVPLTKDAGEPYHAAQAKTLLEQINLLYVAWTRPVRELHAFVPACDKVRNRHPLQRVLAPLLETLGGNGRGLVRGTPPRRPTNQGALLDDSAGMARAWAVCGTSALAGRVPLDWLGSLKIARSPLEPPDDRNILSERKRGLVLHKALEFLRVRPDALDLDRARLAIAQGACALGQPVDSETVEDLAQGLAWLCERDFFAESLRQGLSEAELLDEDGQRHRPDLLVFAAKETLVIDYKTGRQDPEHHDQVRRYLRLARRLPQGRGKPARGVLAYVDARVLVAVEDGERP